MALESAIRTTLGALAATVLHARRSNAAESDGPVETRLVGCCYGGVEGGDFIPGSIAGDGDIGYLSSNLTFQANSQSVLRTACVRIDADVSVVINRFKIPAAIEGESVLVDWPLPLAIGSLQFSDIFELRGSPTCGDHYRIINTTLSDSGSRACRTVGPYEDPQAYTDWLDTPEAGTDFTLYHEAYRGAFGSEYDDGTPVPSMLVGQQRSRLDIVRSLGRRLSALPGGGYEVEEERPLACRGLVKIDAALNGYDSVSQTSGQLCFAGGHMPPPESAAEAVAWPQFNDNQQTRFTGVGNSPFGSALLQWPAIAPQIRVYLANRKIRRIGPFSFVFEGSTTAGNDPVMPLTDPGTPGESDFAPDGRTRVIVEIAVPRPLPLATSMSFRYTNRLARIGPNPGFTFVTGEPEPIQIASHIDINDSVSPLNDTVDGQTIAETFALDDRSNASRLSLGISVGALPSPWLYSYNAADYFEPCEINAIDFEISTSSPLIDCGCIDESGEIGVSDPTVSGSCPEAIVSPSQVGCRSQTKTFDGSVTTDGTRPSPGGDVPDVDGPIENIDGIDDELLPGGDMNDDVCQYNGTAVEVAASLGVAPWDVCPGISIEIASGGGPPVEVEIEDLCATDIPSAIALANAYGVELCELCLGVSAAGCA